MNIRHTERERGKKTGDKHVAQSDCAIAVGNCKILHATVRPVTVNEHMIRKKDVKAGNKEREKETNMEKQSLSSSQVTP